MKLYYFGLTGRGEAIRLVLTLGGKQFEDIKFSGEEWGAKYKAMSPSGQAPWLELDDGTLLSQSHAISMYCATLANMLPSDPLQVARTVELMNCFEDLFAVFKPSMSIKDPAEKLEARKALCDPDAGGAQKMKNIEALVAACSTPFYCGETVTLADIQLFCWLSFLRSGFLDGVTAQFLDTFEKAAALRVKVASIPKVLEKYTGEAGFEV